MGRAGIAADTLSARDAVTAFTERFGAGPDFLVRAPGRINLIGEHTDYTGGLVLPMAIDRAVWVAAGATGGPELEVHSIHFDRTVRISLGEATVTDSEAWAPYVVGVVALLARQGLALQGGRLLIGGNLPPGAGLASSAALQVGVAQALLNMIGQKRSPVAMATLCRQAEQEFAKSLCGIMDQLCCTSARAGHAVLIDCRAMVSRPIPLHLDSAVFIVIDSGVQHSVADRESTERRRECLAALDTIRRVDPSIRSLRDVSKDRLPALAEHLDDTLLPRVRHVVCENARVLRAVEALGAGDLDEVGRLMASSHASLRDEFCVSCAELDELVSIASGVEGVFGARLTGGGFGGCVIVLASEVAVAALEAQVRDRYDGLFESDATLMRVRSADAVSVIDAHA
jgi:galactokinase